MIPVEGIAQAMASDREPTRERAIHARRTEGFAQFDAGNFDGARTLYERAAALGDRSPETIDALQSIYADAGEEERRYTLLATLLDQVGPELPSGRRVSWASSAFDAALAGGLLLAEREAAARRLLETVADAGTSAWTAILDPHRRPAIVSSFQGPLATLDRLEQESYAPPETGLPAAALVAIEAIGHRHAADAVIARAAERLLHGLGAPAAAYRVEATRRAVAPSTGSRLERGRPAARSIELDGLTVVLAGGHPALRRLVRIDLDRAGVKGLREIPSGWEASRSRQAIREAVSSADVAVLIWRQLSHSTGDRVRSAAEAMDVPVALARTAAASAVRQALDYFVEHRSTR